MALLKLWVQIKYIISPLPQEINTIGDIKLIVIITTTTIIIDIINYVPIIFQTSFLLLFPYIISFTSFQNSTAQILLGIWYRKEKDFDVN